MPPLVSVVVPVYNGARLLPRALDSVAGQTWPEREAIVVDDGSRDGSAEVAEKRGRRGDLAVTVLRQENRRQAAARNAGVRAARGDLVAFLDADDRWLPAKLERCVAALAAAPDAVLACHSEYLVEGGLTTGVLHYGPPAAAGYDRLLLDGNCVSTSATVVRRAHLDAVSGFDERLEFYSAEDYDLWLRLSRRGPFVFVDEPLGEYHLEAGSSSRDVVRHAGNVRSVVEAHFAALAAAGTPVPEAARRRRLSRVYRQACLDALMSGGGVPQRWELLRRAVGEQPATASHATLLLACLVPGLARARQRLRLAASAPRPA